MLENKIICFISKWISKFATIICKYQKSIYEYLSNRIQENEKKKKKIFFKLMNEPKHFINALQSMKLRQFNK